MSDLIKSFIYMTESFSIIMFYIHKKINTMKSSNFIKMRLLKSFLLLFALLFSQYASDYDFMVDGLCYNKNSDGTTVKVTYQINDSGNNYSSLSGTLEIPATVAWEGVTYSVTTIGEYAFRYNQTITSVTIPLSVTLIDNSAFYNCNKLTSVIIPNSVTSIGSEAFYNSGKLASVTIPASVTSIGEYAFVNCSGITAVSVDDGNLAYDSRDNCNAIIETGTNTLIFGCRNTVIPNTVTSIGGNAFANCWGLFSVSIPSSVTTIGSGAFNGCYNMTSVTIPNSVTDIGEYAFKGCTKLSSINIPSSVTSIGSNAFYECPGLTSVNVPNLTFLGEFAFWNCQNLASLNIGNSLPSIEPYTFSGCSALTEIIIPNSATSIGQCAFMGCTNMTSVTIGSSVTSIDNNAFYDCNNLRSIHSKIQNPENLTYGRYIFDGVSINYCKVYVPVGTLESYQFTAPWNSFMNIFEEGGGQTPIRGDVDGDGVVTSADITAIYNILLGQDE